MPYPVAWPFIHLIFGRNSSRICGRSKASESLKQTQGRPSRLPSDSRRDKSHQSLLMKVQPNYTNEPTHEVMALFVLRKLILQTCRRSHPVGLDVWYLVRPFVYFHTFMCANGEGSGETARMCSLAWAFAFAYAISTMISWTGSNNVRAISKV